MKIRIGRLRIGLGYWDIPFNLYSFHPYPQEYGIFIALGYLFQFWIAVDFNKYDKNGYLIIRDYPNREEVK